MDFGIFCSSTAASLRCEEGDVFRASIRLVTTRSNRVASKVSASLDDLNDDRKREIGIGVVVRVEETGVEDGDINIIAKFVTLLYRIRMRSTMLSLTQAMVWIKGRSQQLISCYSVVA